MPGEREESAAVRNEAMTEDIADEMVNKLAKNSKFHDILKEVLKEVIDEKLNELWHEVEKLHGDMFDISIENQTLKKENKKLHKRVEMLEQKGYVDRIGLIELQQYNNNNCVLITGIKEKPKEKDTEGRNIPENTEQVVIDIAREKLGLELKEEDFDFSHRTQPPQMTGKPRPILVKFVRNKVSRKVISARKKLKATGIGIHECLSAGRQELFKHTHDFVKQIDKAKACWTWNGNVNVLMDIGDGKDKRYTIGTIENLKHLAAKYN